jgi:hypothetical protein
MNRRVQTISMLAVVGSFTWALGVAWLAAGHDATPYGTTDSAGNPFGFNDPLTPELAVTLLTNATVEGFLAVSDPYYLLCLAMHLVGLGVLAWRQSSNWVVTPFFALQMILFPLGWLAQVYGAFMILGGERLDGEAFQDLPFVNIFAASAWVPLSFLIVLYRVSQSTRTPRRAPRLAVYERPSIQQSLNEPSST